jgi:multidrug efflux pump subunit AcrB
MWIVQVALRRPYTFVVLAILISIVGILAIFTTPTDIFPNINIPGRKYYLELYWPERAGNG